MSRILSISLIKLGFPRLETAGLGGIPAKLTPGKMDNKRVEKWYSMIPSSEEVPKHVDLVHTLEIELFLEMRLGFEHISDGILLVKHRVVSEHAPAHLVLSSTALIAPEVEHEVEEARRPLGVAQVQDAGVHAVPAVD